MIKVNEYTPKTTECDNTYILRLQNSIDVGVCGGPPPPNFTAR